MPELTDIHQADKHNRDRARDSAVIETTGLTKRYANGILALDQVSLSIRRGEVFCLLGANGAGKTTLMNCLLGFVVPASGTARIKGICCHKESFRARRHLTYIPETVSLYDAFTARENLALFAQLGGAGRLSKPDCCLALEQAGIASRAFDQPVREFSKGMRQKLGIAIAMIRRTEAVLLDEPTSGLDPTATDDFTALLQRLRSRGCALLVATHDVFRAALIADRIGIMKAGRLQVERTQRELQLEPLERLYATVMNSSNISNRGLASHE